MHTKNNFDDTVRFYMLDDNHWVCWVCGRCHANCGHHIFGRGSTQSGPERSIYNFAPLNNSECHLPRHGFLMTDEGRKMLFTKTLEHLQQINYTLKQVDRDFLKKYEKELTRLNIII